MFQIWTFMQIMEICSHVISSLLRENVYFAELLCSFMPTLPPMPQRVICWCSARLSRNFWERNFCARTTWHLICWSFMWILYECFHFCYWDFSTKTKFSLLPKRERERERIHKQKYKIRWFKMVLQKISSWISTEIYVFASGP